MRRLLVPAAAVALTVAASASAHVTVTPPFVAAETAETLTLTVPNERDAPMTGLAVTVPSGFSIAEALQSDGWQGSVSGSTAEWSGGSLAPGAEATFALVLEAPTQPGTVELRAEQLYPGGEVVRWPMALTVTPGPEPSEHIWRGVLAALLGILVIFGVAVVAYQRRTRALQGE